MPETFATLWQARLAKGIPMNTNPLPAGSPIVNVPNRASADLKFQAQRRINKGVDRKQVLSQLRTSTARNPAAARPPPPAAAASPSGFGGGGYSGNVATNLGQSSNPGYISALPVRPPSAV